MHHAKMYINTGFTQSLAKQYIKNLHKISSTVFKMRYSCSKQLSIPLVCLYMHLSTGLNLTQMADDTNISSADGNAEIASSQTGRDVTREAFDEMSTTYPLDNLKRHSRSNRSESLQSDILKGTSKTKLFKLLRAFYISSGELTTIKKNKLKKDLQKDGVIQHDFDESRTKRNEECSNNVRQRSICPWEYEYSRNDTLLPALIKTISCQSTISHIENSLIQCHQLYTYKVFRLRYCEDSSASSCFTRKRVKSGCLATLPCVVSTAD